MPKRQEQLFWLYAKQLDPGTASAVDAENRRFLGEWSECVATFHPCVSNADRGDRLWLFRLDHPSAGVPTRFSATLQKHAEQLPARLGVPNLNLKRRSNLPTPLVVSRIEGWPRTDLGLHVVNDEYNAMLVTYSYFEGRAGRHYIPHLQLDQLRAYAERVTAAWSGVACACHRHSANCCGIGCYSCFQVGCKDCDGTGWRHFTAWANSGYPIDYSTGVPVAMLEARGLTSP